MIDLAGYTIAIPPYFTNNLAILKTLRTFVTVYVELFNC